MAISQRTVSTVILLLLIAAIGYTLVTDKDNTTPPQTATQEQYAYIATDMESYDNPTYMG